MRVSRDAPGTICEVGRVYLLCVFPVAMRTFEQALCVHFSEPVFWKNSQSENHVLQVGSVMLTWTLQAVSPSTVLFSIENTLFLDWTEPQQESLFWVPVVMALRCKFGALHSECARSVAERGLSYTCSSSSDHCAAGICLGAVICPGSRPSDALPVSGADLDHVCVDCENNRVQNRRNTGRRWMRHAAG